MFMTNTPDRVEIITSVQRRRRWTAAEKVRMVEETFEPGMTASSAASPTWRCPDGVVHVAPPGGARPVSPPRAAAKRSCRHRTIEPCKTRFASFIVCSARRHWRLSFSRKRSSTPWAQTAAAAAVAAEGRFPMKAVAEVIGASRSILIERLQGRPKKRLGRPPLPDDELVADIKAVIAGLPTYGYRRVHAILKRQALAAGASRPITNGSTA